MRAIIVGGKHDGAVIQMNDSPLVIEMEVEAPPLSIGSSYAQPARLTLIKHCYRKFEIRGPSETDPNGQSYLIYRDESVCEGDVLGKILGGYLQPPRNTTGS